MVVGGSRQETLDPGSVLPGTRQQGVPGILMELVLPDGLDPASPSFAARDFTTELSGPRVSENIVNIIRNSYDGIQCMGDSSQMHSK
ncbi:unnamed protein product [Schistosoma margrebowiei]|uniref:Uncharacterized protein n=1 Tax=Schistosoma margrebowiei TaxID=48269 RepID=A0A183LRL8_9TREM|nr:unnamed protein product [Schistosoma margrebowiei]